MGRGLNDKIMKQAHNVPLIDIIVHDNFICEVDEKTRTLKRVLDSAFAYVTH
jgi:hypothetical protein